MYFQKINHWIQRHSSSRHQPGQLTIHYHSRRFTSSNLSSTFLFFVVIVVRCSFPNYKLATTLTSVWLDQVKTIFNFTKTRSPITHNNHTTSWSLISIMTTATHCQQTVYISSAAAYLKDARLPRPPQRWQKMLTKIETGESRRFVAKMHKNVPNRT